MLCRKPADVTNSNHLYVCDDGDVSTNEMKKINTKLMSNGIWFTIVNEKMFAFWDIQLHKLISNFSIFVSLEKNFVLFIKNLNVLFFFRFVFVNVNYNSCNDNMRVLNWIWHVKRVFIIFLLCVIFILHTRWLISCWYTGHQSSTNEITVWLLSIKVSSLLQIYQRDILP